MGSRQLEKTKQCIELGWGCKGKGLLGGPLPHMVRHLVSVFVGALGVKLVIWRSRDGMSRCKCLKCIDDELFASSAIDKFELPLPESFR